MSESNSDCKEGKYEIGALVKDVDNVMNTINQNSCEVLSVPHNTCCNITIGSPEKAKGTNNTQNIIDGDDPSKISHGDAKNKDDVLPVQIREDAGNQDPGEEKKAEIDELKRILDERSSES
jgi:hypothetical protein